ncbi:EscE/YscE/SsaE family type III secretion system needle protein co-chaperone [Escherichia coli]
MITITELEDEIIKNKEAANIFIEKINDKKNEIHEKMKHPLDKITYNEAKELLIACDAAIRIIEIMLIRINNK